MTQWKEYGARLLILTTLCSQLAMPMGSFAANNSLEPIVLQEQAKKGDMSVNVSTGPATLVSSIKESKSWNEDFKGDFKNFGTYKLIITNVSNYDLSTLKNKSNYIIDDSELKIKSIKFSGVNDFDEMIVSINFTNLDEDESYKLYIRNLKSFSDEEIETIKVKLRCTFEDPEFIHEVRIDDVIPVGGTTDQINVFFNNKYGVDKSIAEDVQQYNLKGIEILSAKAGYKDETSSNSYYDKVTLTTSPLIDNWNYILKIHGMMDGDINDHSTTKDIEQGFISPKTGVFHENPSMDLDMKFEIINNDEIRIEINSDHSIDLECLKDNMNYILDDRLTLKDKHIFMTNHNKDSVLFSLYVDGMETNTSYTLNINNIADTMGRRYNDLSLKIREDIEGIYDVEATSVSTNNEDVYIQFYGKHGLTKESLEDIDNYLIEGLEVSVALALQSSPNLDEGYYDKVILKTSPQLKSKKYVIDINGLNDSRGNVISRLKASFRGGSEDKSEPRLRYNSVEVVGDNELILTFYEKNSLIRETVTNTDNYVIEDTIDSVYSAELIPNDKQQFEDQIRVKLLTYNLVSTLSYKLIVNGVSDNYNNVAENQITTFVMSLPEYEIDYEGPILKRVQVSDTNNYKVNVFFESEFGLDKVSAENIDNYRIDGLSVKRASLSSDTKNLVTLHTDAQESGKLYTLSTSRIADDSNDHLFDDSFQTVTFLGGEGDDEAPELYNDYSGLGDVHWGTLEIIEYNSLNMDSVYNKDNYKLLYGDTFIRDISLREENDGEYRFKAELAYNSGNHVYLYEVSGIEDNSGNIMEPKTILFDSRYIFDRTGGKRPGIQSVDLCVESNTEIIIAFSGTDGIDSTTAENISNYFINGVDIHEVEFIEDGYKTLSNSYDMVKLTTSPITSDDDLWLIISNIKSAGSEKYTFDGPMVERLKLKSLKQLAGPKFEDMEIKKYNIISLYLSDDSGIDESTLSNVMNYRINNGELKIKKIEFEKIDSKGYKVDLFVKDMFDNSSDGFRVSINGVKDNQDNTLIDNKSIPHFNMYDLIKPYRPKLIAAKTSKSNNQLVTLSFRSEDGIDKEKAEDIDNYIFADGTYKYPIYSANYYKRNTKNNPSNDDIVVLKTYKHKPGKNYIVHVKLMFGGEEGLPSEYNQTLWVKGGGQKKSPADNSSDSDTSSSSGKSGGSGGGGGGGGGGGSSSSGPVAPSPDKAVLAKVDKAKKELVKKAGQLKTKEEVKAFVNDAVETNKLLKQEVQSIRSEKSAMTFASTNKELFDALASNVTKAETPDEKAKIKKAVAGNISTTKDVIEKIYSADKVETVAKDLIQSAGSLKKEMTETSTDSIEKEVVALAETAVNKFNVKKIVTGKMATVKATDLEAIINKSNVASASYNTELATNGINITKPIEQKITLDITSANKEKQSVEIDKAGINRMSYKEIDALVLKTTIAELEVPIEVLAEMNKTSTVQFDIGNADTTKLTPEQIAQVGKSKVYEFKASSGETTVSNFKKPIKITIPYTEEVTDPSQVVVYYLNSEGALEPMAGVYDEYTKTVSFKTAHFSQFIAKEEAVNYVDLKTYPWAEKQIKSLAAKNIMTGTSDYTFSPYKTVKLSEVRLAINQMTQKEAIEATTTVIVDTPVEEAVALDPMMTNQVLAKLMCDVLIENGYTLEIVLDSEQSTALVPVTDFNKSAIATIERERLTEGLTTSTFDPLHQPTKGEVAVMFYNLYNTLY